MKVVGIIPARMASTRFPGKPLAPIHGMPMVGHCLLRSSLCSLMDEVYVATCDQEIFDYVESIGGKAVMTANTHERATDRTAEAVAKIEEATGESIDLVVMVQGDEPMVVPEMLEKAIRPMLDDPSLNILNIIARVDRETFESPNTVKVVVDGTGRALYLSRSPIPSDAKYKGEIPMLKQLGIILFNKDFLIKYNRMPATPLETIESVDMLRVIENGIRLQTSITDTDTSSVDTPEDLERVIARMKSDPLIATYVKSPS
ncbi:MAG: 3-deoxy-manno-octulosonate cytidylyltransferase [bacterium]|nr:3-deoxy-manno-octulosonate cytidylyltransferase [bacterium]